MSTWQNLVITTTAIGNQWRPDILGAIMNQQTKPVRSSQNLQEASIAFKMTNNMNVKAALTLHKRWASRTDASAHTCRPPSSSASTAQTCARKTQRVESRRAADLALDERRWSRVSGGKGHHPQLQRAKETPEFHTRACCIPGYHDAGSRNV